MQYQELNNHQNNYSERKNDINYSMQSDEDNKLRWPDERNTYSIEGTMKPKI